MKTLFLAIMSTALLLSSCKKEEVKNNSNNTIFNSKAGKSELYFSEYGNFKVQNGIIYFESSEVLVQTLNALAQNQERAIEAYQGNVNEQTNVEDFLKKAEQEGWNENQTFIDFEQQNNFISLRTTYEERITQWGLNGLQPNDENNPDLCLPTDNLPLLTVLNIKAILGCAGKLYKFMNNGVIYGNCRWRCEYS